MRDHPAESPEQVNARFADIMRQRSSAEVLGVEPAPGGAPGVGVAVSGPAVGVAVPAPAVGGVVACPSCGASNHAAASFCTHCGARLAS